MGQRKRALKNLSKNVCMVKTGLQFEGHDILMAVDDLYSSQGVAPRFRGYLGRLLVRSRRASHGEMLRYSFGIREKLVDGSIWN